MAQTDTTLRSIALRPDSSVPKIQALYNQSYGQCMAAQGNLIPVSAVAAKGSGGAAVTKPDDADSIAAQQSLSGVIADFAQNCEGEHIQASVAKAELSAGATARIITLSTPGGGFCFGEPGQDTYLVAKAGTNWRKLLSAEPGSIEVVGTRHAGYADIELHSLGMCVYAYRWNGEHYVQAEAHDCGTAAPPTLRTLAPVIRAR